MLTTSTSTNTPSSRFSGESDRETFSVKHSHEEYPSHFLHFLAGSSLSRSHDEWWPRYKLIQSLENVVPSNQFLTHVLIGYITRYAEKTEADNIPWDCQLDDQTKAFIKQNNLDESVRWLNDVVPRYFETYNYEITISHIEEEDYMLSLRIYDALSRSEFRQQRRRLCNDMKAQNYRNLYVNLAISQWGVYKSES